MRVDACTHAHTRTHTQIDEASIDTLPSLQQTLTKRIGVVEQQLTQAFEQKNMKLIAKILSRSRYDSRALKRVNERLGVD